MLWVVKVGTNRSREAEFHGELAHGFDVRCAIAARDHFDRRATSGDEVRE